MAQFIETQTGRRDLIHDLILPSLLFAGLGAMTWAVRGSPGGGGMNAHIIPGLMWGVAWWYLARDVALRQSRRYASGWVIFALTFGFAVAGNRGWMQWHHLVEGHLATNFAKSEWEPVSKIYGIVWWFLAGTAWAALPACFLAWCGYGRRLGAWEWTLRIACGLGTGYLAWQLFIRFPDFYLPLYGEIEEKYHDFQANPELSRTYRDNGVAVRHLGYCLGFVLFEVARRDWKNVTLISVVGIVNGIGWAALQNWKWSSIAWPGTTFFFWRCWECSAGVSLGIAFGIGYFLVNCRKRPKTEPDSENHVAAKLPRAEWLLAASILLMVGWTDFWPSVRDLRQDATSVAFSPDPVWGAICLVAAVVFAVAAFVVRPGATDSFEVGQQRTDIRQPMEFWISIALTLVLGWFIRLEVIGGFSDAVRNTAPALLDYGNLYYLMTVLFCCLSVVRFLRRGADHEISTNGAAARRYEWLTTYCGLSLILISVIGRNMTTWWLAPVWFCVVAVIFGIAYDLFRPGETSSERRVNSKVDEGQRLNTWAPHEPILERWGAFLGLLYGIGLSLRKAFRGAAIIYLENEKQWDDFWWNLIALAMLVAMIVAGMKLLWTLRSQHVICDVFPRANEIMWLVLVLQNVVAQVVTGPIFGKPNSFNHFVFTLFYLTLFGMTGVLFYHYQFVKKFCSQRQAG